MYMIIVLIIHLNNLNKIDASGEIIDSNLIKHVENDLKPSSWQRPIAKNITEFCISEAKTDLEAFKTVAGVSNTSKCNPTAIKFSFCLWRELMKACPMENQSKEPQCVQLMKELHQNGDEKKVGGSAENEDTYEDEE